jgi:hypothetical protein
MMELRIVEEDRGRIVEGVTQNASRRVGSVEENELADLAARARLT